MRSQSAWLTACSAALAVALAGCGGGNDQTDPVVSGPRIESATASELADLSDELADRLEADDRCGAGDAAAQLRDRVTAAINEGKVPELYLEELSGAANELELAAPRCVPRPPPPPKRDDDKKKEKKKPKKERKEDKKGQDKKRDEDEQEPVETEPPAPTVTEETTTAEEPPPSTTTGTTTETVP
jgi:hypothetical protein